jgi:hypothetical protein
MVKINFYDNPILVGIAKPGLIIEAERNSRESFNYTKLLNFNLFPTGAYGYIMGSADEFITKEDEPSEIHLSNMFFHPGEVLTQRLTHLKGISREETIVNLISWFGYGRSHSLAKGLGSEATIDQYQGPVLALGEIVTDSITQQREGELIKKLSEGSIYLTEEDKKTLQREIFDYHWKRRKNDFYVKLPDGTTIPIEDLEIIHKPKDTK